MTPILAIPQAIVIRDARGPRVVAQSSGFGFEMEEAALKLAVEFGPRPNGVACPAALFARPLNKHTIAIVQVADRNDGGLDPPLGFRILAIPRDLYDGDPFMINDRFPPNWSASATLLDLEYEPAPRKPRAVEQVKELLKHGDGPLLLGATQALLDGGHVAASRVAPAPDFVRGVWQLLPSRSRMELWPATFAFSARLGFHLVVLPGSLPPGYLADEQAKDYPEGRYELALQSAAESGDQAELDRLFARKTSKEVLRLAIAMVVFALVIAVVMKFL